MYSRAYRVKLFKEGDRLATEERKRRLQGEYKRMSNLRWYIYWTNVGEVGYLDFQKRLKRKRLAQQMTNVELGLDAGVTPEKVNKMISKAIEAQEKADLAAKRRRAYANNTSPRQAKAWTTRQSPAARRYRQQQRSAHSSSSSSSRTGVGRSSSRKVSSRKQ